MVQIESMERAENKNNKESVEYAERKTHIWGTRSASASGILEKVKEHLQDQSVSFGTDADSFLELLYSAFTEYNMVESPEF